MSRPVSSVAAATRDGGEPQFVQLHRDDGAADRTALLAGLAAPRAHVPPKYFYDALGSRLFEAITELDEYYPTRTEAAIFDAHGAEIARRIGAGATLVDLGAGNCAKAERLFPLLEPRRYVAVDISVEFLRSAVRRIAREHPKLEVAGLGLDFSASLDLPAGLADGRRVFFYPGSSVGNFAPDEALALLRQVHACCDGGGLLIGVDLVKADATLEAAYDDALGVTAAFNLNLLRHLNRLIGADFDPAQWLHVALFDREASRIEMHLEACGPQHVHWQGGERVFRDAERIHTENSYKYTVPAFQALLRSAGFGSVSHWSDPQGWFGVFWAH
jgi:dimethylhistidine N-methyltransferase